MSDKNQNRRQTDIFANLNAQPGALGHGLLSQRALHPSQPVLQFNQQAGFSQMIGPVIGVVQQQQSRKANKITCKCSKFTSNLTFMFVQHLGKRSTRTKRSSIWTSTRRKSSRATRSSSESSMPHTRTSSWHWKVIRSSSTMRCEHYSKSRKT